MKMGKKLQRSLRNYFSKLKKIRSNISLPKPPSTSSLLTACKHPKTPSFSGPRSPCEARAATLSDVDHFLCENFQSLYVRDRNDVESSDNRFFVSPRASDTGSGSSSSSNRKVGGGESVAVVTLSMDPYEDLRRSMQEMVDERHVDPGQPLDWDFMEELLFGYLELNDRTVHKHVLRAFADLAVSFRRRIPPGRRKVPEAATPRKKKPAEK